MKKIYLLIWSGVWLVGLLVLSPSLLAQNLEIPGLKDKVTVYRDSSGINHIFAENEEDLFFTQGYLAAKDRTFQFEIRRRQATGTMAEILGPAEIARDKGVRLFKFRGEKKEELNHYHPRGEIIISAFVSGVNAYIGEVRAKPELLPLEFKLLDILPEFWTWQVVISRHQGLLENVKDELDYSRVVSILGPEKAKQLFYFHPHEPVLDLHPNIPGELLMKDILAPYNAFRTSLKFKPEHVIPEYRIEQDNFVALNQKNGLEHQERHPDGSNNWVLSGSKTQSGKPLLANDPHRLQAIPSLRYWVHLHAPGWNVTGGGEPVIPGVSIGHNGHGAWGLTIFETDMEDMRIYDINPNKPHEYMYQGKWHEMKVIQDTIMVKGEQPEYIEHLYTIHGPVTYIDTILKKAVAVQCAWLEPGGAPYLASLRMNQARTWEEFRDASTYNHVPAENMIWADKEGNIGWQATGISPIRKGFSGLVALTGDGSQEWQGYLPIADRPNVSNPENGFIATANENVTPEGYTHSEALGFEWADDFRGKRIREVLGQDKKFTIQDMATLQNDNYAIPARILIPYLTNIQFPELGLEKDKELLQDWDFKLEKHSIQAAIYVMWERKIRQNIRELAVPDIVRQYVSSIQMTRVLQWLETPEQMFGQEPFQKRDAFLANAFQEAIAELEVKLGKDRQKWQYGQEAYKHTKLRHPLSTVVTSEVSLLLDTGTLPKGGYSFSPSANAYGDLSSSGASFRIVVDLDDIENSIGINNPGQSGDPHSPFYKNLFSKWAEDSYFPIPFSRTAVENQAIFKYSLNPKK
jgi:penicillin G amidase